MRWWSDLWALVSRKEPEFDDTYPFDTQPPPNDFFIPDETEREQAMTRKRERWIRACSQ